MDRNWQGCALPQNIVINESNGREPKINVKFSYQGVACRELSLPVGERNKDGKLTTKGMRVTLANIAIAEKKMEHFRLEVARENQGGPKVAYGDIFPESTSPFAKARAAASAVMSDLFLEYMQECKKTVAPQTAAKYQQHIDAWLMPYWGEQTAEHVTRDSAETWLRMIRDQEVTAALKPGKNGQVRNRKPFQPKTGSVKQIMAVFLNTIDFAREVFPVNPLKGIKLRKLWGTQETHVEAKKTYHVVPFSRAERDAIMSVASPEWRRLLEFWWWTGLRIGEVFAIKTDRIDWAKQRVQIDHAFTMGKWTDRLKTPSSYRYVPLIGPGSRALREQVMENAKTPHDHGFVWLHPTTGDVCADTSSQIYDAWKGLLKRAGVTYRNIEQCRHTYASHMLERKEGVATISKVMGHKNVHITLEVYATMIVDDSAAHGFAFTNQYHENSI